MPKEQSAEMKAATARVLASLGVDADADVADGLAEYDRADLSELDKANGIGGLSSKSLPVVPEAEEEDEEDEEVLPFDGSNDAAAQEAQTKPQNAVAWHEDERDEQAAASTPKASAPVGKAQAAASSSSGSQQPNGVAPPAPITLSPEVAAELAAEQAMRQSPRRILASLPDGLPPTASSGVATSAEEDPDAPPSLTGEAAQLLMKLTAIKAPADLRRYFTKASDDEVNAMVSAIRDLHVAWLNADAALINMHVEASLRKEVATNQKLQTAESDSQLRELASQQSAAEAKLSHSQQRCKALEDELTERNEEVGNLTMALQQAILEQKGVAESKRKWAQK